MRIGGTGRVLGTWVAAAVVALIGGAATAADRESAFRVLPYLQNPSSTSMTVRWLTQSEVPGELIVEIPDNPRSIKSKPVRAKALVTNPFGEEPGGPHPEAPWIHSITVTDLQPGTRYAYQVVQPTAGGDGKTTVKFSFRTAPAGDAPVRLMVYSDSETEPESSTVPPVDWPVGPGGNRPEGVTKYLVDQTRGYRENLRVMAERSPDLILVTGDLVESGGEQRDWDEFWRHNAGDYGVVGGFVPLLPALGNHENFGGPGAFGGYSAEAANFGVAKYLTYFSLPDNGAAKPEHRGRYYRQDYGPIAIITVDSSDGLPANTVQDTNHSLAGSHAPDFNPGSEQYKWLEQQLAEAQKSKRFTFVQFHHTAYGSGPHSVPFGQKGFSGQSGRALRVLQPLFAKYGVDAVFSGHDEMLERSQVLVEELRVNGETRARQLHFYDVGMGGDGLRGPSEGFDNPYRKFLAHDHSPEVWDGKRLISGGKHYGHLEVNVQPPAAGRSAWTTVITPVQVFPVTDKEGVVTGFERRAWDDVVVIEE